MADPFQVFFSNQLEILYQSLKCILFGEQTTPFKRRIVVVHGPAMKTWLHLQMAQDQSLGIAMGVEIIYLNQAFHSLLESTRLEKKETIPNSIELALAIEKEIFAILTGFDALSVEEQEEWTPLVHYLKFDRHQFAASQKISKKFERRLVGLSVQLAKFFQEYGRSLSFIIEWEKQPATWQQHLWKRLFGVGTGWTYPAKEFQKPLSIQSNYEIHFFSLSFITKTEFSFLARLAGSLSVYYYLLSPCAVFWSDVRSDKESAYLLKHWKDNEKVAERLENLEDFLRDRNPLLANFGRLGREMVVAIEESQAETASYYLLPASTLALNEEFFQEDVHFLESDQPLTLLQAIQSDMVLMRNPHDSPPIEIKEEVLSIQIHLAPTKKREIQILYHTLLNLIEKKHPSICPCDIIVMAPTINEYVPYIQSIFGSKESQIDFQILDLGMQSNNEIVQGFLHLIALSESRWDASHLLQVFEHPAFQRRHQLTQGDYYTIQQWIEKVGIRWGEDLSHRNELLKRYHCVQGMVEETTTGTWDDGLTRLLLGLTTIDHPSELSQPFDTIPYDAIDFSQGDLLGRWIRLLHSLRDDLAPLQDGTRLTIEDWTNYLTCLLENYLKPDFSDFESVEYYEDLKKQFEYLKLSGRYLKEADFSFETVHTHLNSLLKQRKVVYRENHLQTVRFCSMLPLRSIPCKVISLLGMQDSAFPRSTDSSSLNLMTEIESEEYFPHSMDYDRYLFLEALQSAREHFLVFYQGYNQSDGKELQPSLVVDELLLYLDKHYRLNKQTVSSVCIYRHPFDSFHETYFQENARLRSYSFSDYQAAQAYYTEIKELPHRFVSEFTINKMQPDILPPICTIDIKHLTAVARNPIKFHLNRVLDIYLEKDDDRKLKDEEDLCLSYLDRYRLRHSSLKDSLEHVLIRAEKEGRLPLGLFKQVATKQVKNEVNELYKCLEKHGIQIKNIFQIEFHSNCQQPTQIRADYWQFPALKIDTDQAQFHIIGKIPYVTTQGLLIMGKNSIADAWKAWPQFLLYNYAASLHKDSLEKQLILTQAPHSKKAFFDDPKVPLKRFIDYYLICLKNFSPLLPDWIPSIIEEDAKGLDEKMRQIFTSPFNDHQQHDLRWALNREHLPNSQLLIDNWKNHADELAGGLIQHWYTKG